MKLSISDPKLKAPQVNKSSHDAVKKFRNDISTLFKADNLTAESKFLKIVNIFNDSVAVSTQSSSTLRLMLKKGFEAHQWKVILDQLDSLCEKIKSFERQNSAIWLHCNKSPTCQLTYPEGKFQCTTCGESFEIPAMLSVHMKDVHNVQAILKNPSLKCVGKCNKDFGGDAKAYINHLKQKHFCNDQHIPCPVGCRLLFSGASLSDIESHVARSHACTICNEITINLKLHTTNFHGGENSRTELTEIPEEAVKSSINCSVPLKRPMSERIGPLKNVKLPKIKKKSETMGVTKKLASVLSKKACFNARKAYKTKSRATIKTRKAVQASKQRTTDFVLCSFCDFEIPIKGFSCPHADCYLKFDYRFEVLDHLKNVHNQNVDSKAKCEKCQIELSLPDLKIHMMNEHLCLSAHLRCPLECDALLFESELEIVEHLESTHGMFSNRPKHKTVRFADAAVFRDTPAVVETSKKLNLERRLGPLNKPLAIGECIDISKSHGKLNLSNTQKHANSLEPNLRQYVDEKECSGTVKTFETLSRRLPLSSSPKMRKRKYKEMSPVKNPKKRLDFNQNVVSDSSPSPRKLQPNVTLVKSVEKSQVDAHLNKIVDKSISLGKTDFDIYRYRCKRREFTDMNNKTGSFKCWTCKLEYPKVGFSCNHCDEKFVSTGSLMLHKGLNYGDFQDKMQCNCCSKVFTSVRELLNHELQNACSRHHECPFLCDYLYKSKDELISHLMASHLDSISEEITASIVDCHDVKVDQLSKNVLIDLTTEVSSQEHLQDIPKPLSAPLDSNDGNLSDSSDIIDVTPSALTEISASTILKGKGIQKIPVQKIAKSQLTSVKKHCIAKFVKPQLKLPRKHPFKLKTKENVEEKRHMTFYEALSFLITLHPKNGRFTSGCGRCDRVKPSTRYYRCRLCPKRSNRDLFSNFSLYIEAVVHLEVVHKLKITGSDLKCDSAMCRLGGSKKNRATIKFKTAKEFYNHIIVRHSLCKRHYLCPFHCGQIFNNSGTVFGHLKNCRYNPKT